MGLSAVCDCGYSLTIFDKIVFRVNLRIDNGAVEMLNIRLSQKAALYYL